ncbi:hypothetical protein Dimus_002126, partial [Dionaea muscipula]
WEMGMVSKKKKNKDIHIATMGSKEQAKSLMSKNKEMIIESKKKQPFLKSMKFKYLKKEKIHMKAFLEK